MNTDPPRMAGRFKGLNFIWISLTASLAYWIIEAVRETALAGGGSLSRRIFEPDPESLGMRLAVSGMMLLFGAVIQGLRKRA
jgi:hypothetical protein